MGGGRGAHAAQPAARALRDAGHSVRTVLGADAEDALGRAREAVAGGTRPHRRRRRRHGLPRAPGRRRYGRPARRRRGGHRQRLRPRPRPARARPGRRRAPRAAALKEHGGRATDLGRVGRRWFGTVLASGFDSRVNDRANRLRLPVGRFRYDVALVAELAALRPIPYRISVDGGPVREIDAMLVAVGYGPSYGGGMRICAGARLDDGLLDITIVGACSRRTLLRVFPRVYRGAHLSPRPSPRCAHTA